MSTLIRRRRAGKRGGTGTLAGNGKSREEYDQMAQSKADRQAAAKKAAATRQRNKAKSQSQARGKKAAASRQGNAAGESLGQAKRAAGAAVSGLGTAAKSAGEAAKQAGKSAATRATGGKK